MNSYKRLVPGYEAPVNVAWSMRNRSPLIRVPDRRGLGTRVELRMPDPAANPYLALAVMLAAGLDGVETKADYREPVNTNIWEMSFREKRRLRIDDLPHDLNEACDELEKDDVITARVRRAHRHDTSSRRSGRSGGTTSRRSRSGSWTTTCSSTEQARMTERLQADRRKPRSRIWPHVRETPLVHSPALSEIAGAEVWLKCENLQVTGTFKVRGATNRLLSAFGGRDRRRGRGGGVVGQPWGRGGARGATR